MIEMSVLTAAKNLKRIYSETDELLLRARRTFSSSQQTYGQMQSLNYALERLRVDGTF